MKYNKKIVEEIVSYIKAGVPNKHAALAVGIGEETFYGWMREKAEFSESIKKAQSLAVARNVVTVQKAAKKNWQAAAWWLERRYPEEFALRQKMELEGKLDIRVLHELARKAKERKEGEGVKPS